MSSYESELKIWVVGIREKKRKKGSAWAALWKPTSLKWFLTRQQCWEYIKNEIAHGNFEVWEYKPLRYGPCR